VKREPANHSDSHSENERIVGEFPTCQQVRFIEARLVEITSLALDKD
jgi:hypothetical protein